MKQGLLLFIAVCSFVLSDCGSEIVLENISSYRDIPGVTAEEIAAIEALKAGRTSLTFGSILSTESFITNEGEIDGFSVKFAALLTQLFGIPFRLELFDWIELVEGLAAQTIDFTGELSPTNALLDQHYVTQPVKAHYLRILAHENTIDDFVSAASIRNKTIGFLSGSTTEFAIRRAYDITFTSKAVSGHTEAIELINLGHIDAFIDESSADPMFEQYENLQSKLFFPTISVPVAVATANQTLRPIITVIDKYLDAGGVDILNTLYEAGQFDYAQFKLFNSFTAEEKAYIARLAETGDTVKVVYENINYPISFYNYNEKEYQGLAVDILYEISALTGISFESVMADNATWSEMLAKLESGNGDAQLITELLYAEAWKHNFLWSDPPYASSFYAIISKSDYPDLEIHQVANARVGVIKNASADYLYRVIFPDNDNLIQFDSFTDCIDAIEKGDIDLIMGSEYKLLTFIHFYEKPGYKTNIKLPIALESRFGLSGDETVLCSIISKAQQFVDVETMEMRWTSRTFDYSRKLAQQRVRFMLFFVIVVLTGLTVTVGLFINNIRLNKKLLQLANFDALTNVYNRRYLLELIAFQIDRTSRDVTENYVMIYDLDHFKNVNDKYGHLAGDMVLKTVAQRAKTAIRTYDLLGRYGGEEFLIFVSEVEKETAIEIAERVRAVICASPVPFKGIAIPVSASIGVTRVSKFKDFSESLNYADEAMYTAKKTGRNKVVFFE